ncbi:MAG TPA: thioredoxin domain-containing protein [Alphaproteobacteria bacterium]|nr:thioredoxin domain-containing protein [Alphaproteobacteria bacterium]
MSDKKESSKFIPVTIVLLLAIAALYFLFDTMKEVPPQPVSSQPAVAEQSVDAIPSEETPEEAEEAKAPTPGDLVVKTKTLSIPDAAGTPPVTEDAPSTTATAVDAMMGDRTLGSDDAPIKVVEYSSLTCGHCASFHNDDLPKIKEAYIDTGKVQFIFKEYPLNQPAVIASKVMRCLPADKFVGFMGLLFEQQENWAYSTDYKDKLTQYAKLAGLGEDEINACVDNVELEKRLIGDMQAAHDKFDIGSTPTFIVNGGEKVIVGHQPFSFFQSTFDPLLGIAPSAPAKDANQE